MPKFLWLLRDFSIDFSNDKYQKFSSKEYMNIKLNE